MGDKRRHYVFATWLARHFPPPRYRRVADVAGGQGALSQELACLGYHPTLFELRRPRLKGIRVVRGDVGKVHFGPGEYNLVVGMHPDGATWHILRLAKDAGCPFAVVPCCAKSPQLGPQRPRQRDWLYWLEDQAVLMGFEVWRDLLPIRGDNVVLWGTL